MVDFVGLAYINYRYFLKCHHAYVCRVVTANVHNVTTVLTADLSLD